MKINQEATFFKRDVFAKRHVFVRIHRRSGSLSIVTKEVRELNKREKIYKFFSDLFGLELRKFSQLNESEDFQKLKAQRLKAQRLKAKDPLIDNLNHIDQKIEHFNKKKLFFIPKIDRLKNDLSLQTRPLKTAIPPLSRSTQIASSKAIAASKAKPLKTKALTDQQLISFYRNEGRDISGRTIEDMWNFSFQDKERKHDYIQWLFPTTNASQFNSQAPVLNTKLIEQLKQDPVVIENLRTSLRRMLEFYGLKLKDNGIVRIKGKFKERRKVWLTPGNHNHLRLTRILNSLTLFGLHREANDLYDALMKIKKKYPSQISDKTIQFWNQWKASSSL